MSLSPFSSSVPLDGILTVEIPHVRHHSDSGTKLSQWKYYLKGIERGFVGEELV